MPKVDLDFQRYVERRKGAREAQAREGAAYAYRGDLRVLRTLDQLRPVRLALEATVRLWRGAARDELLGGATRVSALTAPEVQRAVERCAELLHVGTPTVYLGSVEAPGVLTLGTNDDAVIVLDGALARSLTEPELHDVLGRELGRIQNNHVLAHTARHFLKAREGRFVKWIVAPAVLALDGWAKRAQITADRAGLLCTRSLDVSESVLRRLFADEKRVEALRLFADGAYFRGVLGAEGGEPTSAIDAQVAEVLSR